jgi:hypothetical protein
MACGPDWNNQFPAYDDGRCVQRTNEGSPARISICNVALPVPGKINACRASLASAAIPFT